MHRFFQSPDHCHESQIQLSEREANHAIKVLRLRVGDRFVILDGEGQEILCQAESVDKRGVTGRVVSRTAHPPLACELILIQAVAKGKSMDLIVQKATELGCRRIIPVLSERSVVQWDEAERLGKQEKWQTLAIGAIKQCGQPWLPQVAAPLPLETFISGGLAPNQDLSLVASLQPDAIHPRQHIDHFRQEHQRPPRQLSVWIGPEGDFTPAEMNRIKALPALPITLGSLILRSETAAIYALSVMNYELQSHD